MTPVDPGRSRELRELIRGIVTDAIEEEADVGGSIAGRAFKMCRDQGEWAIVQDEIRAIRREIDGREARDLRSGLEEILEDIPDPDDGLSDADVARAEYMQEGGKATQMLRDLHRSLRALLDRSDETDEGTRAKAVSR